MQDSRGNAEVLPHGPLKVISGDTIAAIATAPGRGGVAVIRVSGPDAFAVAEKLTGKPVVGRLSLRKLRTPLTPHPSPLTPHPSPIDEALVLSFKAPRSYTGEDVVEFQCHGGTVTPRRVLEACFAAGARLARRGEFTERAFLNGRLDYDQAESVLDLIDAKTARAADAALAGLSGNKQRELKRLYESALDLSTRLEHALDVDEAELPPEFFSDVASRVSRLASEISQVLQRLAEGKILRTGALVVLAGPPNAGKSSLMNALLEENRAIVSDRPGTTRDSIEEQLDLDGWPIRLVDTAGLRDSSDDIEREGVRRAEDLLAKADLVLWLSHPSTTSPLHLLLHPKCDLGRGPGLNVSAKTGEGLEDLKRAIVAKLEERVKAADSSDTSLDTSPLQESLALLRPLHPTPLTPDSSPPDREIDPVLAANAARTVAERIGTMIGAVYSNDLLDNLFSRFCVGK